MKELLRKINENNIFLEIADGELKGYSKDQQIDADLISEIRANKQGLLDFLSGNRQHGLGGKFMLEIPVASPAENYILSSSQRRLWLLSHLEGGNSAYNIPGTYVFETDVNTSLLSKAFLTLIERHEILRTVFKETNPGEIRQFVLSPDDCEFRLEYKDLQKDQQQELNKLISIDFATSFDLEKGPLFRAVIYKLAENKFVLSYVMHHIISDGWSMQLLINEIQTLYQAYLQNEIPTLSQLRIQYKDYAVWQQQILAMADSDQHRRYWLKQFEGELPSLDLMVGNPRPAIKTYNGHSINQLIGKDLSIRFSKLLAESGATLFMGLLAVVKSLLYKYAGSEDIITGSPVAGRNHIDLENQIGFYINTLPLRTKIDSKDSYKDILRKVRQTVLDAFDHQVYPFDQMVDELNLQRDMSRNPLFDVMVVLQNAEEVMEVLNPLNTRAAAEWESVQAGISKFDLQFDFINDGDGIQLILNYNTDIYTADVISRLAKHFYELLEQVVAAPDMPVLKIDYLTNAERIQLLGTFNNTETPYDETATLVSLFERQVRQNPGKEALVFGNKSFTFRELNQKANQLARYLKANYKIKPDDLVAVHLPRSEWMIISLLGILKSGGAYVPVDPAFPEERVNYIVDDSMCKCILDEDELEKFRSKADSYGVKNFKLVNKPDDLAYVMYTSGSTGNPKGCMLEHKGIVNRLEWMWRYYAFTSEDVILQKTTFTFDVSVWEIFMPLAWGCKMVLCSSEDTYSPDNIIELIQTHAVSCCHFVPGMLKVFMEALSVSAGKWEQISPLRAIMASGEALPLKTVQMWYKQSNIPIYNLYGPTEASIDVTYYDTTPASTSIPVGQPIANTYIYILNQEQQLCPVGLPGEICIGGTGLARGYLNKEALTAQKFTANPFRPGEKIYRTGDIGRWMDNGMIEYLGRLDFQVKLRGYRIEAGEIETMIMKYPSVDSAVVVLQSSADEEKVLVAFMMSNTEIDKESLRSFLKEKLPAYMIPDYLEQVDAFPLNSNGKIDRNKLPRIAGEHLSVAVEYIAPGNAAEEKLQDIWSETLGLKTANISVNENFFRLGGHSLKIFRLGSRIQQEFNVKVELKHLFTSITIQDQARLISNAQKQMFVRIEKAPVMDGYPLSSSQKRLWILSQFEDASVAYNVPGGFIFEGDLNKDCFEKAFRALIERHEVLRTVIKKDEQGEAKQYICTYGETGFHIHHCDLRKEENPEQALKQFSQKDFLTAFDITTGPLLRACLYQVSDTKWGFTYVVHHIICDGWSMEILIKELIQLYDAYLAGLENPLPALSIQYKDYAVWQQEQLYGNGLNGYEAYWLKKFEGELPVLQLQSDKMRPPIKTYNGSSVAITLDKTLLSGIKELCSKQDSTLFMGLLAAVNALFYRYTGQEDIIIGTPVACRTQTALENQVGFYSNTLALRTKFSGADNYTDLLMNVKEVTSGAYDYQQYPFDELVNVLKLQRDMSRHPLFDVQVIVQNAEKTDSVNDDAASPVQVKQYKEPQMQTSVFDMVWMFTDRENELKLDITYNTDVYSHTQINYLSSHFREMLAGLIANPAEPIYALDFLGEAEKQLLLSGFNDTAITFPDTKTLTGLFEQQVSQNPGNTALYYEGTELTYRQLDEKANQLANHLLTHYLVKPGDFVGVMLDRSEKLIIAILGIMKAGAAYVPVDTAYPRARKEFIFNDTGIKVLITNANYIIDLDYYEGSVLADIQIDALTEPVQPCGVEVEPDSLAYIIYTSGSTGEPKGVLITHASISNTIYDLELIFGNLLTRKGLQFSSPAFDASVWEIFLMIAHGGTLFIPDEQVKKTPWLIEKYMIDHSIDIATIPPAFFRMLNCEKLESLKTLITAGEAASFEDSVLFSKKAQFYNAYGPTENSICTSLFLLNSNRQIENLNIPVGKPIANTRVYILDNNMKLVPAGVSGEICVAGNGLAQGYLNRPELTAEKFVYNPYVEGEKIYKTGDIGRWLADGNIEFNGRKDSQLKIKGYRIELGEIEAAIQSHPDIEASAVISKKMEDASIELIAYITGRKQFNIQDIRAYLSRILPPYMIPGHFVQLESLPVTTNGKIDKKALPDPELSGMSSGIYYVEPRNAAEKKLAEIWQTVLSKEKVGIREGFFDLGGDSIKILKMLVVFEKEFGFKIPIADIYKHDTIEQIMEHLVNDRQRLEAQSEKNNEAAVKVEESISTLKQKILSSGILKNEDSIEDIYPMSDIEKGMVFEALAGEGTGIYHSQLILHRYFTDFDIERFSKAMTLIVEKHAILRTAFNITDFERDVQIVYKPAAVKVDIEDITRFSPDYQRQYVMEFAVAERQKPFDITAAPIWRMNAFDWGNGNIVFVFQCHHAIIDGWSDALLLSELNNVYVQLNQNPSFIPEKLKSDYKDFIIQHEIEKYYETIKSFWKNELAELQRLDLFSTEDDYQQIAYEPGSLFVEKLKTTAASLNTTVKTISFSAYLCMIKAINYGSAISTGLVTNTRPDTEDSDKILGCYLNTIPFVIGTDVNDTCAAYIAAVHEKLIELKKYERVSMLEISRLAGFNSSTSNPFFDILFDYVDFHAYDSVRDDESAPGEETEQILDSKLSGFSRTNTFLDFIVERTGGKYSANLRLTKKLRSGLSATDLKNIYAVILEHFVNNTDQPVSMAPVVKEQEKNRLLNDFNDTVTEFPIGQTVLHGFAAQVAANPDAPAVKFYDSILTYGELDTASDKLAHYLAHNYHIQRGDLVGIMLDRSDKMIVALLGILKCGAAYVPVDPEYPAQRKKYILTDTSLQLLVTQSDHIFNLDYYEGEIMAIDVQTAYIDAHYAAAQLTPAGDDLAYVIYTSGSTGNPKGCLITHQNLHNYVQWANGYYFAETGKVNFGLFSSLSFDFTVTSIFCTLSMGGTLTIYRQYDALADILKDNFSDSGGINCIKLTPSHVTMINHLSIQSATIRCVILGGEEVTPYHIAVLKAINPGVEIYNEYGPTEATVGCIVKQLDTAKPVLIGRPVSNTQIYILDEQLQLMKTGVAGEICIGGRSLSKGYLNNEALTAEKFVDNPFGKQEKIYRTGDMGRWLENGDIEFWGRKDDQVKIRGYRVEPGEIEKAILAQEGIQSATVVVTQNEEGDKQLVAYFAASEKISEADLRSSLSKILPLYMVPAHFVQLEALPVTINGKIDKKALPDLRTINISTGREYVPPRNDDEAAMLLIWQKILGNENLGIQHGFFEFGGDSIKILRMLARFKNELGIELSIAEAYKFNTIEKIADHLNSNGAGIEERNRKYREAEVQVKDEISGLKERLLSDTDFPDAANVEDIYPMSDIQKGMIFESMVNTALGVYHDQMVRRRVLMGFDIERFRKAVTLLVDKHSVLRTGFNMVDFESEVQIVYKHIHAVIDFTDMTGLPWQEQDELVKRFIKAELQHPFRFTEAPLWRIHVFLSSKDEIVLVFQCHHAIIDGWSDSLLMRELNNLYLDLEKDPFCKPPAIKATNKDAVIQQQVEKRDESLREFWKEELNGFTRLDLFTGEENQVSLISEADAAFIEKIEQAAALLKTTVKNISLSAYLFLLKVLSGENDVVAGLLTNLRPTCEDSDKILGCFLNTIPMRMPVDGNMRCVDFVNTVADKVLQLKDKERLSLLDISLINGQLLTFGNPFFDILFNYIDFDEYSNIKNHAAADEFESTMPVTEILGNIRGNTHFDFLVDRTNGTYRIILMLTKKLKSGLTAEDISSIYYKILDYFISCPGRTLNETAYLDDAGKKKVLEDFNNTDGFYPAELTIVDLFIEQMNKRPDDIAVVYGQTALSYSVLNEKSNQLANYLLQKIDIQKDQLIGIKLERSEWLLVSMLAILKTGAGYIPLDPYYPEDRIAYMISDSNCLLVLDEAELDLFTQQQSRYSKYDVERKPAPDDIAYVIYTSGSTGKSKGVMIRHENVVNFFYGLNGCLKVDEDDCMLAITSTSFDISVLELLWTLCNGVQVLIHATTDGLDTLDQYTDEKLEMDFSLFFFSSYNNAEEDKYNLLLETVKYADREGFKAVWVPERHFHEFGGLYPNPAVVSSALAMITNQVELRSGSIVSPLHDEIRIAEDWSVVDNLSSGRVGLSFAAGWNQNDFTLSRHSFNDRQKIMYGQIDTVKKLWRGESIMRINGAGKEVPLRIFPKPVQQELKVWITSSGNAETFISAGAAGANILTHFLGQDINDLAHKIKLYRQARKENGYDENTGIVSLMLHTFVGDNIEQIEKIVERPFIEYLKSSIGVSKISLEEAGVNESELTEDARESILKSAFKRYYKTSALIGTVSSCSRMLSDLKAIGVNEVACLVDFGVDEKMVLDNLVNLNRLKTLFSAAAKKMHKPVTMIQSTPSFMKLVEEDKGSSRLLQSLKTILIGGEALPASLVNKIRQKNSEAKICNMYGPTETTIWSCVYEFENEISGVLIGKPILNTRVYILGENMQCLPIGIAGDLYISGKGLAKGYLNNPALSNEKFIPHPFRKGERLYKTGDVARWLPDGNIEFEGRKDDQVKIRGYRIEPGEIETHLQGYPGIKEAIVTAHLNQQQEKELVAYMIGEGGEGLDIAAIRSYLGRYLPSFMIPDYFVQLEKFPLTANGKINRKALPAPQLNAAAVSKYVAPRNELEETLVIIWQDVLGVERIGIQDDYFDLGGNSLKALRLIKKIFDDTGFSVPLIALFNARNIAHVAALIQNAVSETGKTATPATNKSESRYAPLSFNQLTYFSKWFEKESHIVITVDEYGAINIGEFRTTVSRLISRHEILRTVYVTVEGVLMQQILTDPEFDFEIADPVMVVSDAEMEQIIKDAYRTTFDLSKGPLLKINVYRRPTGNYTVVTVAHHILSDGYSANVIKNELGLLHSANGSGVAPPAFQYKDFAAWQRSFVESAAGLQQRDYWTGRLKGFTPAVKMSYSHQIPASTQGRMTSLSTTIDGGLYRDFDTFVKKNRLTYASLLLGVLNISLHKLTGQDDITVFTQVSGRDGKYYGNMDVTGLVGNFTNMLMVRNRVNGDASAIQFLDQVKQNFLEDLEYDAYPLHKLIDELGDISEEKFLQSTVLFNYHNYIYLKEISVATGDGEQESGIRGEVPLQQAMVVAVSEYKNCLMIQFGFNRDLPHPGERALIRNTYMTVLKQVISDHGISLSQLFTNNIQSVPLTEN